MCLGWWSQATGMPKMISRRIRTVFHPSPVTANKYKCRHVLLEAYNGAMSMTVSLILTVVSLGARHQAMARRRAARVITSRMRRRRLRRAFVRENRNLHISMTVHTCNRMWAMCNLQIQKYNTFMMQQKRRAELFHHWSQQDLEGTGLIAIFELGNFHRAFALRIWFAELALFNKIFVTVVAVGSL